MIKRPTYLIADPADPRHGSYAGYIAHKAADVPACEPCQQASRDYQAAYRERRGRSHDRFWETTRRQGLQILGKRHPAELSSIIATLRHSSSAGAER